MPRITFHRFWCHTCQDFTLQKTIGDCSCKLCGTINTEYDMNSVPLEKLKIQRERYNKSQMRNLLLMGMALSNPFSEVGADYDIIEDDAGQVKINEENKLKREKAEKELDDLRKIHLGTGRNDKCKCGSGKKFKHCHLDKI